MNRLRSRLFAIAVAILGTSCLVLYACKAPTVNQPAAIAPPGPIAITSSYQAAQIVSEVNQSKELVYNSATVLKDLGNFAEDVIASDPAVSSTAPVACADYGDYIYTGSVDGSGQYNLTLTFSLCRMNGLQFDGSYTALGASGNMQIALSSIRVVRFSNTNYSAITGTLSLAGLTYITTGYTTATDESHDMIVTGTYSAFDYIMLGDFSVRMTGLVLNYSSSIDPVSSNKTNNLMASGRLMETWTGGSLLLNYNGLFISKTENYSGSSYISSDTTISGTLGVALNPASYGASGLISVSTPTTPIHHDYSTGLTTAGGLLVAGNGSADATFNASGDIDVTVPGGSPISFNREYFLNNMVNFYGMEQTVPQYVGVAGVAPTSTAAGSKWPATMTVTALSTGPNLGCFTDVHVNYYNPTDMLVPAITTYVDYHVNESCTPPGGIPYQQTIDIDNNGYCDFGLDIAAAQQDVTSGGVEHFTATAVPEGYYVISINNFNCDTTIGNMASIIVGDYMFGTYNCTYTTSNTDGPDPAPGAAWLTSVWARMERLRS